MADFNMVGSIREINELIDRMHSHVLDDFNRVVELVKHKDFGNALEGYISQVVKELQYYDIIHQKLQHIKSINHWIEDGSSQYDAPRNVYQNTNLMRLNFLQFQLSYYDYLNAVTAIRQTLQEASQKAGSSIQSVFELSEQISTDADKVNSRMLEVEREFYRWCRTTVKDNFEKLSSLYSMQCERAVLQAYLENPAIDPEAIRTMGTNTHSHDESIDLF